MSNPLRKKVLLINASSREGSNTGVILSEIKKDIENETVSELISLRNLNMSICDAGNQCLMTGECKLRDDLTEIYPKLIDADVIVFGSPIYFGTVSSLAKIFIDRMQPFWARKELLGRPLSSKEGFLVLVSASGKESFFKNASQIAGNFFAVVNAKFCGGINLGNVEEKSSAAGHPEFKKEVNRISKKILSKRGCN